MSLSLSPRFELSVNRLVVLLLSLVMLVPAAVFAPHPEPAKAASPCDLPFADKVCDAVAGGTDTGKDLITGGAGVLQAGAGGAAGVIGKQVGKQVGKVLEKATSGVFDQLTTWVGEAAGWFFLKVTALITQTTSPNLFQRSFVAKYKLILSLAAVMAVMVTLLAAADGAKRGDIGGLLKIMAERLPAAIIAMVVGVAIIQLSLNMVDALSAGVAKTANTDIQQWFKAGADWMVEGTAGKPAAVASGAALTEPKVAAETAAPGFVLLISALLGVVGAFGLWLELLMRDAAIYVCAVFFPLSLAASIWPKWAGAMKKTLEILIVLVVSKFFLVFVIALAASFLGKPDSVETMLAGSAMMIAGLLVPFFLMKLVPFVEGAQMTRGPAAMAQRTAGTASQVSMMRRNMATGGGGRSKAGGSQSFTPKPQGGGGAGVSSGTGGAGGAAVGAAAGGAAGSLASGTMTKGPAGIKRTGGIESGSATEPSPSRVSSSPASGTAPAPTSTGASSPVETGSGPVAPRSSPTKPGGKAGAPSEGVSGPSRAAVAPAAQPKPAKPSPSAGLNQQVATPPAPTSPRPKGGLSDV